MRFCILGLYFEDFTALASGRARLARGTMRAATPNTPAATPLPQHGRGRLARRRRARALRRLSCELGSEAGRGPPRSYIRVAEAARSAGGGQPTDGFHYHIRAGRTRGVVFCLGVASLFAALLRSTRQTRAPRRQQAND